MPPNDANDDVGHQFSVNVAFLLQRLPFWTSFLSKCVSEKSFFLFLELLTATHCRNWLQKDMIFGNYS